MKPFMFYSLFLALCHRLFDIESLRPCHEFEASLPMNDELVISNLGSLANAMTEDPPERTLAEFVDSSTAGTNTKKKRHTRFSWFCRAMEDSPIK